ncbi:MAG: glycosyltransferase family 61 protein [Chloroflexi bacterium]|jgi:capsular polysaccharide biosynthesis protein|nr:glycosyltransferase family 61 protein [Chloroflexota bacterium]
MTTNWGDPLDQHPIFDSLRLPPVQRKKGRFSSILFPAAYRNYYHWLHDSVPRLAVLDQVNPIDCMLIVPKGPAWIRDSVALLNLKQQVVEFGAEHWEIEHLVIPSCVGTSGYARPWSCNWLRQRMGLEGREPGTRRLYISRLHATTRRLLNEDDVLTTILPEGFELVTPENLSFTEQVGLFSQANIIVAPHGAGLANVLFSPRGTRVVELTSPMYVNPCFYSLCGAVGHRYACVFGETARREEGPDRVTMVDDITVKATLVMQAIRSVMA